ncbi:hypothetical protein A1O1_01651 [Capronia coronata CBS 617.96]|uniref:Cytochrome P450 oxidoreductase n=1 Tax=Capronia coronata CBS 617.96 TaxID=1182541 RepID=W9YU88_9EURO|nr:uncharacterized protein A1O1_01651 [Capronia coronata CBS 617.96]EXJ93260.1 hypothetical protein A1O1_01651 [Capronia coronata CBS 617.96]
MLALYLLPAAYLIYISISAIIIQRTTRVPGPWYTHFTSLVLKYHEFSKNRRLWIHSLHERYGPVVRLAPNEVSFANLEGMKEIYQSGGSGYDKTEFYDLFKQYGERTMFSTLNKQDHAQRKKLFADRYAMTNIMRSEILKGIEQRAASVMEKVKASVGRHLDVYVILHCYALDCASHFLFNPGGTDTLNNPSELPLMKELSYHDSIKQRLVQHYWPRLNNVLKKIFSPKSVPRSKDYVLSRASTTNESETSLIHKLQSKSSSLSTIQMAAECMDHMAAGIDTTGDSLCFIMYEISLPRSQHIQTKLRAELLSNPTARFDDFPYLDAVIKEGLRLFPPIPMSHPRYVPGPSGRHISGHYLPSGSIVSCQPYSLHLLNASIWGPSDPTHFVPERWLDDEKRLVEMNRLFFSFGAGGRGCIGRSLAITEMKTLLRELYLRYTTVVSPDMKGDMSIDDQIIASRPKDQTCLLEFVPVDS